MAMHKVSRDAIERRFLTDSCEVRRPPSGEGTLNETTFEVTFGTGESIYSGRCLVQSRFQSRESGAPGQDARTSDLTLKLPTSARGVQTGDTVTVSSACNPDLDDTVYEIERPLTRTHSGSKSFIMREWAARPHKTGTP